MAKINREFLVPYLQNICAVELQIKKLGEDIARTVAAVERIEKECACNRPYRRIAEKERLTLEDVGGLFVTGFVLMVIALILCGIFGWFKSPLSLLAFFIPFIVPFIASSWMRSSEQKEQQEYYDHEYYEALALYKRKEQEWQNAQPRIQEIQKERQELQSALADAFMLREQLYDVNIIPMQYRNIYVAVYLHQYFSTGLADDLDMVLQTFILEEIKVKIDKVIALQTESILNDRIMIANQQKSLEAHRDHQIYMENKARQIASSMEEQTTYLSMIEANTSANAYFAAACYYK